MAVYVILSSVPHPQLATAIQQHYSERSLPWGDRAIFVHTADSPRSIAEKIGVKTRSQAGELIGTIEGVIITQLSPSYWGWTGSSVWEWLKAAHQQDSL